MKSKILHITTHMGGGVGKVLSGITAFENQNSSNYEHKIILLEKPIKMNFIDISRQNHVDIHIVEDENEMIQAIEDADIVQLEWWHHPLMAGLLAHFPEVSCRLIVWSHISGCFYPYLPPEFLQVPMKFMFTSRYSLENPYWQNEIRNWAFHNCKVINSSGGFDNISVSEQPKKSNEFIVGYIGTQSYSKLNPDFLRFCYAIKDLPGINFRMVGDQTNMAVLLDKATEYEIDNKFTFIEYVTDVNQEFQNIDVFGYLLNPTHFGTTENVLLEAMAAELPVVALNQCAEKFLVIHNQTGLLVNNIEEYADAIKYLYNNPEERKRLGKNARNYVLKNFSINNTVEKLHEVYDEVISQKKKMYDFSSIFGDRPYQYFLSCLPPNLKKNFHIDKDLPIILKDKSKSSILQFYNVYPKDEYLKKWYNEINIY